MESTVEATAGCDALFHLAAVSNVNDVYDAPVDTVRSNVLGTTHMLEADRRNDIGRTVLASTVWVYARRHGRRAVDRGLAVPPAA